jgi:hypothetical protein
MRIELEGRLERVGDTLPKPEAAVGERARSAALVALRAAEHPGRRRSHLRARPTGLLLAAGAICAAVAVVILVSPWQSTARATERALAALGDRPVIHAIVENTGAQASVVDLSSGETQSLFQRSEYWYDDERSLLRTRLSVGGRPLPGAEIVQTPEGSFTDLGFQRGPATPPRLDPVLAGFASRYRDALESGQARVIGQDVVDGREAIILRIDLRPGPAAAAGEQIWQEVAVDADQYRPLRFRVSSTSDRPHPWWRVVAIETIARDPAQFAPPERAGPRPGQLTGTVERTLTPSEAATALQQPVLWPGPSVDGIELTQIRLMKLTTRWTDGSVTETHTLEFQYGADLRTSHLAGEPSLIIREGTSAKEMLRGGMFGGPPSPGKLLLTGLGNLDGSPVDVWLASMERDGVYISLESIQRELILTAARSMVRLR